MRNVPLILIFLSIFQEQAYGLLTSNSIISKRANVPFHQKLPFFATTETVLTNENIKISSKKEDVIGNDEEAEKIFYSILSNVDEEHEKSSFQSKLASENILSSPSSSSSGTSISTKIPKYECVYGNEAYDNRPVAYRSIGSKDNDKILNEKDMECIRMGADEYWKEKKGEEEVSRFTLQFKGNSEIHLDDLCEHNPSVVKPLIDHVLCNKIYPLIRHALKAEEYQLCIYDALYVRYNAEKAKEYYGTNVTGASQPLHRDLGLYSVNICLNDSFEGGGTFFENMIECDSDSDDQVANSTEKKSILYPISPGHCLIHNSWERHAGAPTTKGIRDIIVLFVSARQYPSQGAPIMEQFARIKVMLRPLPVSQRIYTMIKLVHKAEALHIDKASYGEAFIVLGFDLMQKHEYEQDSTNLPQEIRILQRYQDINEAIQAFTQNIALLPNDARGYFHLASALDTRLKYFQQYTEIIQTGNNDATSTTPISTSLDLQTEVENIITTYQKCIKLEQVYTLAGLKQADDWMEACLRLGTLYAQYGNFVSALQTFQDIVLLHVNNNDYYMDDNYRKIVVPNHILEEALKAIEFCEIKLSVKI